MSQNLNSHKNFVRFILGIDNDDIQTSLDLRVKPVIEPKIEEKKTCERNVKKLEKKKVDEKKNIVNFISIPKLKKPSKKIPDVSTSSGINNTIVLQKKPNQVKNGKYQEKEKIDTSEADLLDGLINFEKSVVRYFGIEIEKTTKELSEEKEKLLKFRTRAKKKISDKKRIRIEKRIKESEVTSKKLTKLKNLSIRYLSLVILNPELFPISTNPSMEDHACEFVTNLFEKRNIFYQILFDIAAQHVNDEETLKKIFSPIFLELRKRAKIVNICMADYRMPAYILGRLASKEEIAKVIVNHPEFIPEAKNGNEFEEKCLFGPFMNISCFGHGKLMLGEKAEDLSDEEKKMISKTTQYTLKEYSTILYNIMFNLFQKKSCRNQTLEFLSRVTKLNEGKGKMVDDGSTTSSFGFMLNFGYIMLKLCSFIHKEGDCRKVNAEYVMDNPLFDFREDTKLGISMQNTEEFVKKMKKPKFSNRDRLFFGTFKTLHLSYLSAMRKYQELQKNPFGNLSGELNRLLGLLENKKKIDQWEFECHILNRDINGLILQFYRYGCNFLLSKMESTDMDSCEDIPDVMCQPEYFISDVVDYLKMLISFIGRNEMSFGVDFNAFVNLFIRILFNKKLMKNPNERMKIGHIMLLFCPTAQPGRESPLAKVFLNNSLCREYLMSGLMELFVDAEEIENSYHAKHTPRYEISLIVRSLWKYQSFRRSFEQECVKQTQRFNKFFNLLLNDSTKLLEDSMDKLKRICELERLKPHLEIEEQKEKTDEEIQQHRGNVRVTMQLSDSTIEMFKMITKNITKPFYGSSMGSIERIAIMLNFFLKILIKERGEMIVSDHEELNYDPQKLISDISEIYLNFFIGKSDTEQMKFCEAVVNERRSFSLGTFKETCDFLKAYKGYSMYSNFLQFVNLMEALLMKPPDPPEEIILLNPPEKFLDAMMFTLMKDPVELPPNGSIMDRESICRGLLDNQVNPFTKTKLTEDMLIPRPRLKEEILKWKETKWKTWNSSTLEEKKAVISNYLEDEGDFIEEDLKDRIQKYTKWLSDEIKKLQ